MESPIIDAYCSIKLATSVAELIALEISTGTRSESEIPVVAFVIVDSAAAESLMTYRCGTA